MASEYQISKVAQHLIAFGQLSRNEAQEKYSIMLLADVIRDMRKRGWTILTRQRTSTTQATYVLISEPKAVAL